MRVTTEAIEPGIAVAHCDHCGERFYRSRANHRFCSPDCHEQFHQAERRIALEWYRAKVQRQPMRFGSTPDASEIEIEQRREESKGNQTQDAANG
jgi:hypothetical protein